LVAVVPLTVVEMTRVEVTGLAFGVRGLVVKLHAAPGGKPLGQLSETESLNVAPDGTGLTVTV
jgi:hypothetical protein